MRRILALAALTGTGVFVLALGFQWVIYDRILHEDGIRVVGSTIAAGFAILLVYTMGVQARNARITELRRLAVIALTNHHIRNSLQAIDCCALGTEHAVAIQAAIERIERVLAEIVPEGVQPPSPDVRRQ